MIDWCYLSRSDVESVDHVLLHCSVARGLWMHVLGIMNFYWVMLRKVGDVLMSWNRKFLDPLAKAIWKMIPSCIGLVSMAGA